MKFVDFLRRYHISPLKYEDERVLIQKDYMDLYIMLSNYFKMKEILGKFKNEDLINEQAVKSIEFAMKNSLIEPDEAEIMDKLMGFDTNPVVEVS